MSLRHLAVIGLGLSLGGPAPAEAFPQRRPETNYFPGSRRCRQPTSKKHRGDCRATNRPKNKAARQSRKRNKK